jgi:Ca2+-binding EF-hand superfamily protein
MTIYVHDRFPLKDQSALQKLFDKKTKGVISEAEWTDMMNYLYDENDSVAVCMILKQEAKRIGQQSDSEQQQQVLDSSLVSKFIHEKKSAAANRFSHEDDGLSYLSSPSPARKLSPSSSFSFNDPDAIVKNITRVPPMLNSQGVVPPVPDMTDKKRLGYRSNSVKAMQKVSSGVPWKEQRQPSSPRSPHNEMMKKSYEKKTSNLKLPFEIFLKIVLDFQLHSHERYLQNYRSIFHEIDEDCDGILNIREFFQCYSKIRNLSSPSTPGEELEIFANIVRLIDPMETDIITFSASATALSKVGMRMTLSQGGPGSVAADRDGRR